MRCHKYTLGFSHKKRHQLYALIIGILLVVGLTAGLGLRLILPFHSPAQQPIHNHMVAKTTYQTVEGTYLFSGTIMLGRAVETYATGDYNQPFSGMNTLGQYDDHIGVLECPITNNVDSYQNQVNNLVFNCGPQWLPALKAHFPIVNLSSDHLNDQGPAGYAETVSRLQAAGFQTVGNFNPHAEPDDCKVVVLPVRLLAVEGKQATASLPVAMCSYNYKFLFSPQPGELESIQKWSRIMPVIALLNCGTEYRHTADDTQVAIAHQMIDNGASFVIGNGTHWVQNTEVYKGKLIVYSMGNFIFDQLDQDGRLALNLSVKLRLAYDSSVSQWLDIGKDCAVAINSCLGEVKTKPLPMMKPTFTFAVVGSYGGDRQVTTKADSGQQMYVEQRANWAQTQQLLSQ